MLLYCPPLLSLFFFFNDTATTEIYTLSLHDALPISIGRQRRAQQPPGDPPRTPAIEMPVHEAFKAPLERTDQRLLRLGRAGPPFGADVLVPVRSQRQHSHLPLANCSLERRVHGVWAVLGASPPGGGKAFRNYHEINIEGRRRGSLQRGRHADGFVFRQDHG